MRITHLLILLLLINSISAQNILQYYSFDQINSDNTIDDNSENNRAATVNGNSLQLSNTNGINGNYLSFPNTDEYIEYKESALVTQDESFTVSFVFKADELSEENEYFYTLYTGNYSGSFSASIRPDNKRIYIRIRELSGTLFYLSSAPLDLTSSNLVGRWNHFVFTHDATTKKSYFYLNGILQEECQTSEALRNIDGITLGVYSFLDGNNPDHNNGFKGNMDDFILSKTFLTESDIINMPKVLSTELVSTSGCHSCDPITSNHVFSIGDEVIFRVKYSKEVDVIGTPQIQIGNSYASYDAVNSSSTYLYFRYTLTSSDLEGVSYANDLFYGGSILTASATIEEKGNLFGFSRVDLNLSHPFDLIYPNTISKKDFLDNLDYSLPSMTTIKTEYDAENYDEALKIWRDTVVNRFRDVDFIEYSWHSNGLNTYYTRWAQYINGELSESDYLSGNIKYSLDYQNLKGFVDNSEFIDWNASAPTRLDQEESTFIKYNSFPGDYWKNNNPTSRDNWLRIVADFSQRDRPLLDSKWDSLSTSEQDALIITWRPRQAQSILDQGLRLENILKTIGLFSKNLEGETFTSDWDNVLSDKRAPVNDRAKTDLINEELLMQIVASVVRDYPDALLERYDNNSSAPNQRLHGLIPVAETSILFPELNQAYPQLKTAKDAIQRYMDEIIHLDGGMLEQSFNYNVGDSKNLEILLNIINDVPSSNLTVDADFIDHVEKAILEFKRLEYSLLNPHMTLPLVGNNGHSHAPKIWNEATERTYWINSVSNLDAGYTLENTIVNDYKNQTDNTPFHSIVFPYSGYNALRNGWSWDDSYLFMNTARTSKGHQSADNNGIQVFAFGRSLLQSDGPPDYYGDLPSQLNDYFSEYSSLKVNTVMVDGLSQAKDDILLGVPSNTIGNEFSLSDKIDYIQGNYSEGYGTIQNPRQVVVDDMNHNREVIFLKDFNLWIVSDKMENTNNTTHTYSQVWNFPGESVNGFLENEVNTDVANKKVYTSDAGEPNVLLQNFGDVSGYTQYKYYNDQTNYLGFMARGISVSNSAADIHIKWEATGNTLLGTIIKPYETDVSPFQIDDKSANGQLHVEFTSASKQVVYQNGYANSKDTIGDIIFDAKSFVSVEDGNDHYGFVKGNSSFKLKENFIDVATNSFQFYYSKTDNELKIVPFTLANQFEWSADDIPVYETNPSQTQIFDINTLSNLDFTSSDVSMTFYPNPASDIITFDDNTLIGSTIELVNLEGSVVFSTKLLLNELLISDVASGIYFLMVRKRGELVRKPSKIIIK